MLLTHYSQTPIDKLDTSRMYLGTRDILNLHKKPSGLWVSCDEDYGWKEWCIAEGFRLEALSYVYSVVLKPEANIVTISSPKDFEEFNRKYCELRKDWTLQQDYIVNWSKVSAVYQGIIIAPYNPTAWFEYSWYYGWDCSSGCIWDLSCIKEFKIKQEEDV